VTGNMRAVLVDWLVQVSLKFRLLQETLFMTVAIIDRFLQVYTFNFPWACVDQTGPLKDRLHLQKWVFL